MKLFRLCNAVDDDTIMLDSCSHSNISLISGNRFGVDPLLPFEYEIDQELPGITWPTTFLPEPVFAAQFISELRAHGINNIEEYPISIRNGSNPEQNSQRYRLVNIIGRISCADMNKSEFDRIGEYSYEFDVLVVDKSRLCGEQFFRLHECPTIILVSGSLVERLEGLGFPDIFFEPVAVE